MKEYYNKEIKSLSIPPEFNDEIKGIPEETEEIIFYENTRENIYSKFDGSVDLLFLLQKLTHLTFGFYFNQKVNAIKNKIIKDNDNNISLHSTKLQKTSEMSIIFNISDSLTHLTFGAKFNQSVSASLLPKSITHLTFGYYFNQSVDDLPWNLSHLTFNGRFNRTVNNLPINLTHLTFGEYFNQSIDNLPNSLIHLSLGYNFNQKISTLYFSNSIKYLTIWSNYLLNNNLPVNIEEITIFFDQYGELNKLNNLPTTLKIIKIHENYENLINKIPFGCELVFYNRKKLNLKN